MKKWWHSKQGLKPKLIKSHLSVALFGILLLIISLAILIWLKENTSTLVQVNIASVQEAKNIQTGLQKSFASLRGWMAIPDKKLATERENAWNQVINPALKHFKSIESRASNKKTEKLMQTLQSTLINLETWQWHIQDVAQTPGNYPDRIFFEKHILPSAKNIISLTTHLINTQTKDTSSSQFLKELITFRGAINSSLLSGSSYIVSNKITQFKNAKQKLESASKKIKELETYQNTLPLQQQHVFSKIKLLYQNYEKLFTKTLNKKKQEKYNSISTRWLAEFALPLSNKSENLLNQIIEIETNKKTSRTNTVITLTKIMTYTVALFIILLIFISYYLATKNAKKLLTPISKLLNATEKMSEGTLNSTIKVESKDEIGTLTKSFNEMFVKRQQAEQKVQQTIETAVDAILTINTKGIIQTCNKATLKLFGYKKNELIGNNISILMPEPHKSQHNDYISNYLKTGVKHIIGMSREFEAQTKSGEIIPIILSVSEIKSGDEHLFTGIIHNNKHEKEQEAKMKLLNTQLEKDNFEKTLYSKFEDRLRGIDDIDIFAHASLDFFAEHFEIPVSIFYRIDPETQESHIVKGYGFKERRNRNTKFSPGETLVGECAASKKMITITEPPQDYIKIASGMGNTPPKQIIIMPLIFEDLVLGAIEICSLQIISEENTTRLNTLCNNIATYFNLLLTKTNLEELLKKTEEQKQYLQQQEEELRSSNEELESQASSLKQSEEELRSVNEELHTQVGLIEKQKNQLIQKSAELEQISQYKSEFLANMSHELRTPLNSLLILAQGFLNNKGGNLTHKQLEEAKIIYEAGSDLLTLINDILDISKVEAGKLTLETQKIQLYDITEALKRQFSPIAENKNIRFTIDWDAEKTAHPFYSDPLRLLQILKNLLSNALKFTEKGSVTLKIKEENDLIEFDVMDTGIGIPQEKQELIFSEFQQADGSTSRKYGGTGLGLSISKKLTTLMQGSLTLVSSEGKGSTFILKLPLHADGIEAFHSNNHNETPRSPQKAQKDIIDIPKDIQSISNPASDLRDTFDNNKPTILIIDDDEKFCKILAESIQKNNFQVLIANTGNIGLQLAAAYKPTGILLDLGLPDMSGESVLENLKQDKRTHDISIHLISARDKSESMTQKGAFSVLQKPINEEDILNLLSLISGSKKKHILFIEDDLIVQQNISETFSNYKDQVNIQFASKASDAKKLLSQQQFSCLVVDLGLPDDSGITLIRSLIHEMKIMIPIIIYTARELTPDEHKELTQYASKIIIKGEHANERLFDEVSLFINHVEQNNKITSELTAHHNEALFKNKTILLVDDDLRNTFSLSRILEAEGFNVIIADNGKLALEKLHTEKNINLILMDMMMPVMDGAEAIKHIRQQDDFKKIPIIALTARATEQDRINCINVGANDYMSKPVDMNALLKLISVWLTN